MNSAKLLAMPFPVTRLRRMRQSDSLRSLIRETRLTPTSFIYPLFVCPGEGVRKEIGSMPGVFNISVDEAVEEAREAKALGVGGIILFGLPEKKDEVATGAAGEEGNAGRATAATKRETRAAQSRGWGNGGGGAVATQVAVKGKYESLNHPTLEDLAKRVVSQAKAGM